MPEQDPAEHMIHPQIQHVAYPSKADVSCRSELIAQASQLPGRIATGRYEKMRERGRESSRWYDLAGQQCRTAWTKLSAAATALHPLRKISILACDQESVKSRMFAGMSYLVQGIPTYQG